jgi:hypothetical protein
MQPNALKYARIILPIDTVYPELHYIAKWIASVFEPSCVSSLQCNTFFRPPVQWGPSPRRYKKERHVNTALTTFQILFVPGPPPFCCPNCLRGLDVGAPWRGGGLCAPPAGISACLMNIDVSAASPKALCVPLPYFGKIKLKWSYPCNRPWRSVGLWDVEDPTLSRHSAVRLSALRTGHTLSSRNNFLFLVLISVRGWVNPRA